MLALLQALVLNAGDYLTPVELATITGIHSLHENNNVAARLGKLRQFFRDTNQRFIETRASGGYAIRWCPDRTFIWLERVPS